MKVLSRGMSAMLLVGLFAIAVTGAVFAQGSGSVDRVGLQSYATREVVTSWVDLHPLEYYLALPVSEYLSLAMTPSWQNAHPLEYYLALPVGEQPAMAQVPGWEYAHPLEYYLALPDWPPLVQDEMEKVEGLAIRGDHS